MTRSRIALLAVPIMVVGGWLAAAGPADAGVPSGATHVAVTAGANTNSINAALTGAASISGKVTSAAGNLPVFTTIAAYSGQSFAGSGFTDGNGHYTIGGLAKSSTGYAVCVNGAAASGGGSSTGYVGRCYKTVAFSGGSVPSSAAKIPLTVGQHKTGVNFSLQSAAAISGKVTSTSGTALADVFVQAHNRSNGITYGGVTGSNGSYTVKSLPSSAKGYTVCFDAIGEGGSRGYLSRCYKNKSWTPDTAFPSTATEVTVTLGHTHTGISQALPGAGAIAGTVTDASNGKALPNADVQVFSSSGHFLTTAITNSKGQYTAKGLPTATADKVCVFGPSPSASVHYKGLCYKTRPWSGGALPSGITGVKVAVGQTHTGISFKLGKVTVKLGSIAGTVTEAAGGTALHTADVFVYSTSGAQFGEAHTTSTGAYKVNNLRASATGYVVCVKAGDGTGSATAPTPDTGWAPRCYKDAAWNGGGLPGSATKVPLTAGQNKTGVNVALHVGGEISGIVTSASTHTPLLGIDVQLFSASTGRRLGDTLTSFEGDGTYSFTGLSPAAATSTGGYVVCFDGRFAFEDPNGYRPQCYKGVAWNG